ncbi:MAG: tRNA uridine-5-carboxymethylaminomethyl(34) synthesis GTPase MnmE [Nitrospirae bacterium]|nr:tRNA uridine-5-carboxymethylaminomethyl(34) synthesis GTPase MnmE [Nitrospirota bacterium]
MYLDDTIAAISTPLGEGGIGIVRISGKDAVAIADRIFVSPKGRRLKSLKSHSIAFGFIVDPENNERIDEVLTSVMIAPNTYTREDTVEINCHGGMLSVRRTLELLLRHGARIAEPGEFTRRAFLNGRIDLSQAEAVIDVIRARTEQAGRIAFRQLEGGISSKISGIRDRIADICVQIEAYIDFPEEDIDLRSKEEMVSAMQHAAQELSALSRGYDEGRLFREGIAAAIVGKPNVGKSSLLNALIRKERAIVTEMPGTTRDVVEDYLNINGLPLIIMDTAGIRETHDLAEMEGVKRSIRAIEGADLAIAVFDSSRGLDDADIELAERIRDKKNVVVIHKSDMENPDFSLGHLPFTPVRAVRVSSLTGEGIDLLKDTIYTMCISSDAAAEGVLITNIRHKYAVDKAFDSICKAERALVGEEPIEAAALFLREALDYLGEIAGVVTTDDILNRIFSRFCIGK